MEWNKLQENEQWKNGQQGSGLHDNEIVVAGANTPHVYRNYKDRVFRLLFKNKVRLLELYNALSGSNYTDADSLIINTLENAVYKKMKNDVCIKSS